MATSSFIPSEHAGCLLLPAKAAASGLKQQHPVYSTGCRKLAYNRELAASINSGLHKMNDAKTDIGHMKVGVEELQT